MKARAMNAKRRNKERQATVVRRPEAPADGARDELLERLDAELNRLPDHYRVPVLLCELEGKSRKEAAALLGLPEGTLSWRLAQARKLLARRLSRHGAVLPAGALAAALAPGAASAWVPPALLAATARAGMRVAAGEALTAGAVPARVLALTEGVVKMMLLSKLKVTVGLALALFLGAGMVGLTYRTGAAEPVTPDDLRTAARPAPDDLEELRAEIDALRKGLQATRDRVKALEAEVQSLRGKGGGGPRAGAPELPPKYGDTLDKKPAPEQLHSYRKYLGDRADPNKVPRAEDPLAEIGPALKKLRANPDNKEAVEALEKALQRWMEQTKPKDTVGQPKKN
jgi:hypothetical protein